MGKKFFILCVIILCLFLLGCKNDHTEDNKSKSENIDHEIDEKQSGQESGDENMDEKDIYDFYFINKAPAATEKHSLDELIKIYFSSKGVAVDLENNEIYENPRYSTNGVTTFEDPMEFNDKDGLLEILENYHVQEWKEDYTTEDPDSYQDGFGWQLLLQFEDGTVERHRGNGSSKEDVTPENFDDFAKELDEFINKKIKEKTS